jgi:hypothetical protein
MTLWSAKSTGVMFGGVTDEERGEEGLESVFWNDMYVLVLYLNNDSGVTGTDVFNYRYAYQLAGNGRWISMNLKKPKKKGGGGKKKALPVPKTYEQKADDIDIDGEFDEPTEEIDVSSRSISHFMAIMTLIRRYASPPLRYSQKAPVHHLRTTPKRTLTIRA